MSVGESYRALRQITNRGVVSVEHFLRQHPGVGVIQIDQDDIGLRVAGGRHGARDRER